MSDKYYNEHKTEINEIVSKLRNNQIAIFCGAGAVNDFTKITWKELFDNSLDLDNVEVSDYYKLASYYELVRDRPTLVQSITSKFSKNPDDKNYSKHIKNILNLPITEFWTTNYDNIIETMIENKIGIKPSVIFNIKNLSKYKENKRYKVYKLNGSIEDSESLVITEEDYNDYYHDQKLLFEHLKKELILKSFIFIGYSFADKLVLDCLTEIRQVFEKSSTIHYRISVKDNEKKNFQKIESEYFDKFYNIKTIYVDSFEEIDDLLEHIYDLYKSKNVFISGSFRNFTSEQEDRANNLCKVLVKKLIENGYNIYTGDGKRLGSYIISNATIELSEKSAMYMQERLKIMPYIDHTFKRKNADDPERIAKISRMIEDCSATIFLYGQSNNDEPSLGVMEEYKQSNLQNLKLIPVASTGYAAEKILNDMESKFQKPFYLEKYIEKLRDKNLDVEQVADVVIEILNNTFQ